MEYFCELCNLQNPAACYKEVNSLQPDYYFTVPCDMWQRNEASTSMVPT